MIKYCDSFTEKTLINKFYVFEIALLKFASFKMPFS